MSLELSRRALMRYNCVLATQAVTQIQEAKLVPVMKHGPTMKCQPGHVYQQDPAPGSTVNKGGTVTIWVSTGKPKVEIPTLKGLKSEDAIAKLKELHLVPDVHDVTSSLPADQVTASDPKAGTQVVSGTKVRINVSSGPKPIGVPPVIGQSFDSANSELQAAGFKVSRVDVDSNQPKGTVVDQSPAGNSFAGKGATVTLKVSKGPTTSAVPDVTSEDESQATNDLKASGFNVHVVRQDTNDPTQDGIVLTQNPGGGQQAKPGTTVTITVGHFVQLTTPTTTPTP